MESKKLISAIGYLMFFVPLIADSENEEYKFHANQGLILLIFSFAIGLIGSVIPVVGWFIVLPIGEIICLILGIIGIVNVFNGEMKELPVIGKFRLIK